MNMSPAYAAKMALARELAVLGARAVTITNITNARIDDARKVYKAVHNSQSNPGKTPSDHQWYFQSPERRQHGAMLLMLYAKFRLKYQDQPDAHALAVVCAYKYYKSIVHGQPKINLERFNLLIGKGYKIGWRDILKGGATKFEVDNLKVVPCKRCQTPHIAESYFLNYICTTCA